MRAFGAAYRNETDKLVRRKKYIAFLIIGIIICIVWACGGCKNRNQRNFARAYLIFLAIGAILGFVGYLMLNWLIDVAIEVLRGM